jgi:hypothetical protein
LSLIELINEMAIKKHRKVYFLGAGASLCAYSFSVSGLFEQSMLALQHKDQELYGIVISAMSRMYPEFHYAQPWLNKNDIEDALDLLEAYDELFGQYELVYKSKDYFKKAKEALLYGICWAFEPITGIKDPKALRSFVKELIPGDCVITLNWDTVTERLIYENHAEKDILYCPDTYDNNAVESKITFIKLHGSIDWFEDSKGVSIPEEMKNQFTMLGQGIWRTKNFQPVTGRFKNAIPFIVPPQSRKNYNYHDIKMLWQTAFWYLLNATKIHIIGCSVRDTDINVKALLQNSIKNGRHANVVVVNPEECMRDKLGDNYKRSLLYRFGVNIKTEFSYIQSKFEDWVLKDI